MFLQFARCFPAKAAEFNEGVAFTTCTISTLERRQGLVCVKLLLSRVFLSTKAKVRFKVRTAEISLERLTMFLFGIVGLNFRKPPHRNTVACLMLKSCFLSCCEWS